MKKFVVTLFVAVLAAVIPFNASAYSKEMAQLATELNNQLAGQDNIQSISYDGNNLIMTFQKGMCSPEEEELLGSVTNANDLKPIILAYLQQGGLDSEAMNMFGQILSMFDSNLMIRMPLKSGKSIDIVLSPSDLTSL